jgi:hypothetical protein
MVVLWSNRISAFHRVNFTTRIGRGSLREHSPDWPITICGASLYRRAVSAKPLFLRDTIESEPAGRETDSFKRTRPACVFPSFFSIAGEAWIHSFGWFPSVDYGIHRRGQKRLDFGAGVVFLRRVDRSLRETLGGLIFTGKQR